MTMTQQIISELATHGITVSVDGDEALHVHSPRAALTPEIRALLAEWRMSLIAVTRHPDPPKRYSIDQLVASGKSVLGCATGEAHYDEWRWIDSWGRYRCLVCDADQGHRKHLKAG